MAGERTTFSTSGAKPAVHTGWAPKRTTHTDVAYTDRTQAIADAGVTGSCGAMPFHAFLPSLEAGRVDMSGYKMRGREGFVNFDYGFWDEASQSFWHANHRQPNMKVYQSTKERYAMKTADFDRIVYCITLSTNYDPAKAALAAMANGGQ